MRGRRSEVSSRRAEAESRRDRVGLATGPRRVEVRIDELVLHGFAPRDRHAIAAGVEEELAWLFTGQLPAAAQGSNQWRDRVDGGAFPLPRGARPHAIGALIARAIHGGLAR